jgi:aspartate/tyrosine/aromatic aminotransferase
MGKSNDTVLALNQKALSRQKEGVDIINGSIGMMYSDEGELPVSPLLRSLLASHVKDEDLSYSGVGGSNDYAEGVRSWFLGKSFDEEASLGEYRSIATMGGTGAITLAFYSAKKGKSIVLLPSLGWPNYEAIAKGFGYDVAYYELFEKDHFNMASLTNKLNELNKEYDQVTLVINDPCENPTGYCLSLNEWKAIIDLLNESQFNDKVSLVLDAAYFDFASKDARAYIFTSLKELSHDFVTYLCFSFSKTLSFYGLRIGDLGIYSHSNAVSQIIFDKALGEARALWSVPNHMAMNTISDIMKTPLDRDILVKEVESNRDIVAKRASIFFSEADKIGLKYFPYKYGFFVSLPFIDAFKVSEILIKKDIFLAPIKPDVLRVALCAIPTKKVYGLANEIFLAGEQAI